MTLIIGARCTDGLVLAADRKVIRGGEADYMDKISEIAGIVLAFEGLTGIRDDFLLLLRSEIDRTRGFTSIYEMKLVVEDIVGDLSRRYCERLGEEGSIGALLGGLSSITTGTAELYYIHPQGYGESVRYRCSGHGADYAHSISKFLLSTENSVQDNAYRAAFIISWVSEDIDMMVGGEPQVAMIRDNVANVDYLPSELIRRATQRARQLKPRLANAFGLTRLP
jgi:20S proteasome alpha/beta subunit